MPCVLLGDQDAPCAGSRARTCPVPGHPCLDSVTAHDVLAAVEKVAREKPAVKKKAVKKAVNKEAVEKVRAV